MRLNPLDPGDKRTAHYRNIHTRVLHDDLKHATLDAGFTTRTNLIGLFACLAGALEHPHAMLLPPNRRCIVKNVTAWEILRDR